jgi:serine/threonine protein kinase
MSLGLGSSAVEICSIFTKQNSAEFITDLLSRLLEIEPTRRPSAKQILDDIQSECEQSGPEGVLNDPGLRGGHEIHRLSSAEQIIEKAPVELTGRPSGKQLVQDTQSDPERSKIDGNFEVSVFKTEDETIRISQITPKAKTGINYDALSGFVVTAAETKEYLHQSTLYEHQA